MKTYQFYVNGESENLTLFEICNLIATRHKKTSRISDSIEGRKVKLIEDLQKELKGFGFGIIAPSEEKPMRGSAYSVMQMKGSVRIQYRAGHGKYSYAPVIEVFED